MRSAIALFLPQLSEMHPFRVGVTQECGILSYGRTDMGSRTPSKH